MFYQITCCWCCMSIVLLPARMLLFIASKRLLNLSDTHYVKTTSLLRRPVVNSHLHNIKGLCKATSAFQRHLSHTILHIWLHYLCPLQRRQLGSSLDFPPLHSSSNWDDARYWEMADLKRRARPSPPRSQDGGGGRASLRSRWAVFVRGNSCG